MLILLIESHNYSISHRVRHWLRKVCSRVEHSTSPCSIIIVYWWRSDWLQGQDTFIRSYQETLIRKLSELGQFWLSFYPEEVKVKNILKPRNRRTFCHLFGKYFHSTENATPRISSNFRKLAKLLYPFRQIKCTEENAISGMQPFKKIFVTPYPCNRSIRLLYLRDARHSKTELKRRLSGMTAITRPYLTFFHSI